MKNNHHLIIFNNTNDEISPNYFEHQYSVFNLTSSESDNYLLLDENRPSQSLCFQIGSPQSLFRFRDLCVQKKIDDGLSILIIGGDSCIILPQFYIFKKLVNKNYGSILYKPAEDLHKDRFYLTISNPSFDGVKHVFKSVILEKFELYSISDD